MSKSTPTPHPAPGPSSAGRGGNQPPPEEGVHRFIRSVATASWIDQNQKLPLVDKNSTETYLNNDKVTRSFLLSGEGYRFCNFLEVEVTAKDGRITGGRFMKASGMYAPPSFFGIDSEKFDIIKEHTPYAGKDVTFVQTVGARTHSPEVIGGVVGGGVGGGVVVVAGRVLTRLPLPGPWGLATKGAGIGLGYLVGRETAEENFALPPIWTTISLKVYADGKTEQKVVKHSLFPSMSFFRQTKDPSLYVRARPVYDAMEFLETWKRSGWGEGNPWKIPDPRGQFGDGRTGALHPQSPAFPAGAGNFRGSGPVGRA